MEITESLTEIPVPTPKNGEKKSKEDLIIESLVKDGYSEVEYIKKKISKLYWILPIIFVSIIGIGLSLIFLFHVSIVLIILYFILAVPIFLFTCFVTIIRLYKDKTKIKNWIILKLATHFVICHFFFPSGKTERVVFRTRKKEFTYDNGLYIVDEKCIVFDSDRNPNLYYFYGIPSPLRYNFDRGEIYYSSENLKLFKEDKLLEDIHKGQQQVMNIIIIVLIVIVIILSIINLLKGSGTPQIPQVMPPSQ